MEHFFNANFGFFDGVMGVLTAIIGWLLAGFRGFSNGLRQDLKELRDTLSQLSQTLAKEYVTRPEHDNDMRGLRESTERATDLIRSDIQRIHERLDNMKGGQ